MLLFRCSSEMHRSKGGSCHLCDTRCYSSSTTENKGRSPQTSTFLFCHFSCVLLLLTTGLRAGDHFVNYRNKVSKNKIDTNSAGACTSKSCTAMYCNYELPGFCFVVCFVLLSCEIIPSTTLPCMKSPPNHFSLSLSYRILQN